MCIMPSLLYLILVALSSSFVNALITFKDVDELAVVTTSCFKTIKHHDVFGSPLLMNQGRAHLSQYGNELESVVASALVNLDANLTIRLNVPMNTAGTEPITSSDVPCSTIVREYRVFLTSTAWLLNTINEKLQMNRWNRSSQVFISFSQTQSLWASRRMNKQNLSFIEQQISLYRSTDCFAKNEVLRQGVEVVEYMNDILDSFL